jgi:hypothetical protein
MHFVERQRSISFKIALVVTPILPKAALLMIALSTGYYSILQPGVIWIF